MLADCNGKRQCTFKVLLSSEKGYTEKVNTNLLLPVRDIPKDKICVLKTLSSGLKDLLLPALPGMPFSFVYKAKWTYERIETYESIVKLI